MEVFKKIGSKERFYEIMSGVNKIKLNEDVMGSEGGLADKAVQELISGSLDIEQVNNQVSGNESIVEIVGRDDIGSKFIFKFTVTSNETDQQGVNVINDANITELIGDMPKYDAKFEMDENDSGIAEINKNYKTQLIDAISEYVEFESDAETVSDEMYEEAIKLIDRVPYNKGSEEIQTHKAYTDQKPTNSDVRVKSDELDSFVSEDMNSILHYSQAARDSGMLYPQAASMGVTNQYILKDALNDIGVEIINIVDIGDKYEISFMYNGVQKSAKLKKNYGSASNVRNILKKKLGINEENVLGSEEDDFALPPDYSPDDIPKPQDTDDGSTGIDPYEQEPQYDDSEEATPEENELYGKAYDNLTAAGNQFPTPDQIDKEVLKLKGQDKPVQKTRTIPRGAEQFWETHVVTDISADDVVKQSYNSLPNEKKKQLIFRAQEVVDEALGDLKISREEYIKNIQREAIRLYKESILGVNEDEKKSDYPDQIGKTFKPKSQIPKKKKRPQSVVKLKEDGTPEPAIEPDFDEMGMGQQDQPEIDIDDVSKAKEATGDQLAGGLGDDKSPNQFDPDQVARGVKVEMEHTDNPLLAIEIALDHLTEDPNYYGNTGDDPEEMAQTHASQEAEEQQDDELTDELLGFKPHNVGDYANEELDFAAQERNHWDKEDMKQNPEEHGEESQDPETGHDEYLKQSGQMKSFDIKEARDEFPVGTKVRISDGSGVDSNKTGIVVSRSEVKTDGRGVPVNVQGAYKPVDWSREVAIKLDDGNLITMFKNRVHALDEKLYENVELARQVLKNRRLNEGMTKTDAVQLLIRHNIK